MYCTMWSCCYIAIVLGSELPNAHHTTRVQTPRVQSWNDRNPTQLKEPRGLYTFAPSPPLAGFTSAVHRNQTLKEIKPMGLCQRFLKDSYCSLPKSMYFWISVLKPYENIFWLLLRYYLIFKSAWMAWFQA